MDPLAALSESLNKKEIPLEIYEKILSSREKVEEAIKSVEKASGIKYPDWYVYPKALAMKGIVGEASIIYSRFYPLTYQDRLYLLVQLTPPLVLYSSKDTLLAVLAHEMLHYINFAAKIKSFSISSSEISVSVFESAFADQGELYSPEAVFRKGKKIIRLLKEKFDVGLKDEALNKKTISRWINKNLPTEYISPEQNTVRVSVYSILNYSPEESLKRFLNWT